MNSNAIGAAAPGGVAALVDVAPVAPAIAPQAAEVSIPNGLAWRTERDRLYASVLDAGYRTSLVTNLADEVVYQFGDVAFDPVDPRAVEVEQVIRSVVETWDPTRHGVVADAFEPLILNARSQPGGDAAAQLLERVCKVFVARPNLDEDLRDLVALFAAHKESAQHSAERDEDLLKRIDTVVCAQAERLDDYQQQHGAYRAARDALAARAEGANTAGLRHVLDELANEWVGWDARLVVQDGMPDAGFRERLNSTLDAVQSRMPARRQVRAFAGGLDEMRAFFDALPQAYLERVMVEAGKLVPAMHSLMRGGSEELDLRAELLALREAYRESAREGIEEKIATHLDALAQPVPEEIPLEVALLASRALLGCWMGLVRRERFFFRAPVTHASGLGECIRQLSGHNPEPVYQLALQHFAQSLSRVENASRVEELRRGLCTLRSLEVESQLDKSAQEGVELARAEWLEGYCRWVTPVPPVESLTGMEPVLDMLFEAAGIHDDEEVVRAEHYRDQMVGELGREPGLLEDAVTRVRGAIDETIESLKGQEDISPAAEQLSRATALVAALVELAGQRDEQGQNGLVAASWLVADRFEVATILGDHIRSHTIARRDEASRLALETAGWVCWGLVPACSVMRD